MNIKIDLLTEGSFLNAAKYIVYEFVHDNPNALNSNEIENKINFLAGQLFFIQEIAKKNSEEKYLEIDISYLSLPEEMKTWALAKKTFHIQPASVSEAMTPTTDVKKTNPYTYANNDWSDVKVVLRAKEGQRGAWFFANPTRGSVVVKGQEGAEIQLMGTVFLRFMGINAPDAKIVARSSAEGKQLSELGEIHELNARNPTHYIVMNRVRGPSYSNLSSSDSDIRMVINNLESLGELAVYDLVLGNFDRFQLDSTGFNAGNIMFENGLLNPIDSDCLPLQDRLGFTKLALKKIIEGRGDYQEKIAWKLERNLGDGLLENILSREKIKAGMDKAISKLIAFTENMVNNKNLFKKSCMERGAENILFPDHLEELLLHVKKSKK